MDLCFSRMGIKGKGEVVGGCAFNFQCDQIMNAVSLLCNYSMFMNVRFKEMIRTFWNQYGYEELSEWNYTLKAYKM